ncbi:MAG TPA: 1-acyl-sn-glycerol-3-phosphate acyltransferase [Jatrophihabitans sp.]|jgi:1-acyl-sn-glycerol-3-phosphate acyltransferase|uniref:1-acyl-sn-glycerol-3-phosphate acyltransferase n=1 Tax=Jatrophihabitans sp. TaxID=1932789 RepID=UPI002F1D4B4D
MTAGLPPRWLRRCLVDPLWVPLAVLLSCLFAVLGALAWLDGALIGLVRPVNGRLWRLAWLAWAYLTLNLVMVLGCFGLWLTHPLRSRRGAEWLPAHVALLRWCLDRLQVASHALVGFTVLTEQPLPPRQAGSTAPFLVFARHAGPGDSFALVHLIASRLDRCPRVVLKAALQWDPGLDVLLNRLRCYFVPSRSGAGEDRVEPLSELAAGLGGDDALLLFPEGGNWTPHRHRRAVRRLWRSGRRRAAREAEANTHVLPPYPGGALACLQARPDAEVLVVAHTGLDTLTSPGLIWRALPLGERPMRISWWQQSAATIPADEAGQRDWLEAQWDRMQDWVAQNSR